MYNNKKQKANKSRSRSRSEAKHKKERNKNKKEKKWRRSRSSSPNYSSYHSHSSSSRSNSKSSYSSYSSSSSSSESKSNNKRLKKNKNFEKSDRKIEKEDNFEVKDQKDTAERKPRPRINPFMLSGILLDQKKMNNKLDDEEVSKANQQFKQLDKSERKSTLMSGFINKTEDMTNKEEYFFEYVNGAYIKVLKPYICDFNKCGKRFRFYQDMNEHLENHLKNDKNNKNIKKK